jgi:hypothetical protein
MRVRKLPNFMSRRRRKSRYVVQFVLLAVSFLSAYGQQPPKPPVKQPTKLQITVVDENDVAVLSARVLLRSSPAASWLRCDTDFVGRCAFASVTQGMYELRVEKPGFYALDQSVEIGQVPAVEVHLSHFQEVRERVDVVESPPTIDPTQVASTEQLTASDVLDIPFAGTHDYRNLLNFIPGVVNDNSGQPHLAGSETYQTYVVLDDFNVTQPANGLLLVRVNTDAIRSISAETSRYPAEYGKGSGGVLDIKTGIGDDHFRFTATNFIPSVQNKNGLQFDSFIPRVTFSGPLKKGKVWFFQGLDGEYDNFIITGFPNGATENDYPWRFGNLTKMQANLTSRNILTASYLLNEAGDPHAGISLISPAATTPAVRDTDNFASLKDQHYFKNGELLETGFGFSRYQVNQTTPGVLPYVITPETAEGNYYMSAQTTAQRYQGVANLYLSPKQWHGRHEIKTGVDVDRIDYMPTFDRTPISYLSEGTMLATGQTCQNFAPFTPLLPTPCSRYSTFSGLSQTETYNLELSGYMQDAWSPADRVLIQPGVRFDWDEIVRAPLVSPRLAGTYVLDNEGDTKLSAGIGLYYDATNLVLISRPFAGERTDYFFGTDAAGNQTVTGPILTTFTVNRNTLQAPRFVNWSVGIERKLPGAIYVKAEFIQRRGTHGFVYNLPAGEPALSGNYLLMNTRDDHYYGFQISGRHTFHKSYMLMASYIRSRTTSNQVLDFNVDNPVFSPQLPGPYPWDAPNRFLSWGFLPLIKGFDFAYSAEARTGFPFNVVNDQQELVGLPGSRRFPTYFTLNVFAEKRFHLLKRYWAVRGGFENVTNRQNPFSVNNDINSPQFLTFGSNFGRSFTTRIRLVGRK